VIDVSSGILDLLLKSLKTHCRNLQNSKKKLEDLKTSLKELKKESVENKNKIKLVEFLIENTRNEIKSIGSHLETDGKGLKMVIVDLDGYHLTPKQKEYWIKFNKQVMAKWDMSAKDWTCKILMDF
jgi:predicted nuclease with TOPRIM domain